MRDQEIDPELRPHERVVAAWRADGYTRQFTIAEGGRVAVQEGAETFAPEELTIEHLHRYEGTTDPGDEELLVALSSVDGTVKGTLTLAYGAYASADEAEVARRLKDGRRQA